MARTRIVALAAVVATAIAGCDKAVAPNGDDRVSRAVSSATSAEDLVQVAIRFASPITGADRALLRSVTAQPVHYEFRSFPALIVRLPRAAIAALRRHPRIVYVQEGAPVYESAERGGWQFGDTPLGHNVGRVASVPNRPYGNGIGVAVIDGGIACNLPDLQPACAGGVNVRGDGSDPMRDVGGHGTRIASLIAAVPSNGIGVAGVAPGVRLYSIKAMDNTGSSTCDLTALAIDQAIAIPEVSIISASYQKPARTTAEQADYFALYCQVEADAVERAVSAGILFVASSGNTAQVGDSVAFPARLPGVVAVSGVRCRQFNAEYCPPSTPFNINYIEFWTGSTRGNQVDISAGAYNMYALLPTGEVTGSNGTSFAVPIVVGTAALVMEYRGQYRNGGCLAQHLTRNAHKPKSAWSEYSPVTYGAGIVDAYASVVNPFTC